MFYARLGPISSKWQLHLAKDTTTTPDVLSTKIFWILTTSLNWKPLVVLFGVTSFSLASKNSRMIKIQNLNTQFDFDDLVAIIYFPFLSFH